jgi:DNA-binding MarR family transcriptional regulator
VEDSVDRQLEAWAPELPAIDLAVEGIVDRVMTLSWHLKRSLEETVSTFGVNLAEWSVVRALRLGGPPYRSSPGRLAEQLKLSSGAMTNRLDRLEQAGLAVRLPDPADRRALQVELTEAGHRLWDESVGAQAAKEAAVVSALDELEKEQLNALLRRLLASFDPPGCS